MIFVFLEAQKRHIKMFCVIIVTFLISGTVTQGRYPCYRCNNKSYRNKGSLKRHLIYECGMEPQFICTVAECNYRCKRKDHLKLHSLIKHPGLANQVFSRK